MATNNYILSQSSIGHTLHHNGVFSQNGQWIVFDGRNDDTKIGETSVIGLIHVKTGEEKFIYETQNPTLYGPGVGAASFNPVKDVVAFIHGLSDANKDRPYGITRRTGVGIDIHKPYQPFFLDARDVTTPYSPGSLRGGTHSHGWSGDGQLISFTYNDELVEPDLRVVGVMLSSGNNVKVNAGNGNNEGSLYAAVVTQVVSNPAPGSDEINKAFDECWVGKKGYMNKVGNHIPYAIAFQGNVKSITGELLTEIFIVDIDPEKILADSSAVGTKGERPHVPAGITQKRITFSNKGLSATRHWLRSSPDGKYVYALAKDDNDNNQIIQAEINTGEITYITQNNHSIDYSFNVSNDGKMICYVAENNVFVFDLLSKTAKQLTDTINEGKIVGAPSFSPNNNLIAYNQYIKNAEGQEILQIRIITL